MPHVPSVSIIAFTAGASLLACSGSSGDSAPSSTFGSTDTAMGGSVERGGQSSTDAGDTGNPMVGGSTGFGGTTKGGSSASGGSTGFGGTTKGGSSASGGSTTTGGSTAKGGSTPKGACVESSCGTHKWACWKMPTSVSENLPNPQSYTDLGKGTVVDNVTCLTWEQSPPSTTTNWQPQYDRCAALSTSSFGGYTDWRLPTRIEMASITDIPGGGYPKVFTTPKAFYATGSLWYKTILTDNTAKTDDDVNMVWAYGSNGYTSNALLREPTNDGYKFTSRCVRGNGAGEAPDEHAVEPANHYTLSNGEVTDNYTSLVWQQGYSPTLLTHAEAVSYCATLSLNGSTGWRVPALNELASTVNEAKVGGAIVETAFPNNPNGCKAPEYWFWAAEAYGASNFWGLSYCDGFTGYNAGASGTWNYFPTANVRCVR